MQVIYIGILRFKPTVHIYTCTLHYRAATYAVINYIHSPILYLFPLQHGHHLACIWHAVPSRRVGYASSKPDILPSRYMYASSYMARYIRFPRVKHNEARLVEYVYIHLCLTIYGMKHILSSDLVGPRNFSRCPIL